MQRMPIPTIVHPAAVLPCHLHGYIDILVYCMLVLWGVVAIPTSDGLRLHDVDVGAKPKAEIGKRIKPERDGGDCTVTPFTFTSQGLLRHAVWLRVKAVKAVNKPDELSTRYYPAPTVGQWRPAKPCNKLFAFTSTSPLPVIQWP
jgi:hypothetical protein